MKPIAINGLSLFDPGMVGIKRNTLEMLKQLDIIVDKNEVYVLVPQETHTDHEFSNIAVKVIPNKINSSGNKITRKINLIKWLYIDIKRETAALNAISVDLLLQFPWGSDVVMIYDCIPELFPQYFKSMRGRLHSIKLRIKQSRSVKKAKLILSDSYSAANDISRIYKAPMSMLKVVPCAWDHFRSIAEDDSIIRQLDLNPGSYYFTLGNDSGHKNIRWVLEAAASNTSEIFVISGKPDKYRDQIKSDNVIFAGYVNDGQMKSLMKNCKAFIHPSFYEGFGIPPMEAMSVGADCIVSDAGSLPEIYKDSVWYIDPYDYNNIDMRKITCRRKESNEKILNEYSWKKSARMFLDAVNELR